MSAPGVPALKPGQRLVQSLLDQMVDNREYGSVIDAVVQPDQLQLDWKRGIAEIEAIRQRPCVCYVANMVKQLAGCSLDPSDLLPFVELLRAVPLEHRKVDVFLATP